MPKDLGTLAAEFGGLNEIVQTVTLACALRMTKENIIAALRPEKEGRPLLLPTEHPLDAFALDDGPQGPIPAEVRFRDFVWQGGPNSWRLKPLQRFAALTTGTASFILVDVDGGMHAYEIDEGKLFACEVALAFVRRGDIGKGVQPKLLQAAPLLRGGLAIGKRAYAEG